MKHNKLKLTDTEDRGFKRVDWLELGLLAFALVIIGALIFACVVAALKVMTEIAG